MFFLSEGFFKKITKDRNKHPDVFLNVKLKKTVIVQVDEIKQFNRGNETNDPLISTFIGGQIFSAKWMRDKILGGNK